MEPRSEADRCTRRTFWKQAMNDGWDDVEAMAEGSYTMPGQRWAWRRSDPDFNAACAARERDDDRRVIDVARKRAMEGDSQALSLCFRAVRGLARPAPDDPRNRMREPDPLPPAVAGAMIEAGLRARGEELPELPERRPPVNLREAVAPPAPPAPASQPWRHRRP
jgi:hypothetical protein